MDYDKGGKKYPAFTISHSLASSSSTSASSSNSSTSSMGMVSLSSLKEPAQASVFDFRNHPPFFTFVLMYN